MILMIEFQTEISLIDRCYSHKKLIEARLGVGIFLLRDTLLS